MGGHAPLEIDSELFCRLDSDILLSFVLHEALIAYHRRLTLLPLGGAEPLLSSQPLLRVTGGRLSHAAHCSARRGLAK